MDGVESFIAESLMHRVRHANVDGVLPACEAFTGAVLFVDMSGYTGLAESLCERGPAGVEELGKRLDHAFATYVKAVHETEGEIACFAGDAFVAYWSDDPSDPADAARRAAACAALLHAGADQSGASAPALHIGLSAGDLWAALLGDVTNWQLLLAGPAVRQACIAAARATPGETVTATTRARRVTSADDIAEPPRSASGERLPEIVSVADFTPPIPRRIQEYLVQGYAAWIAQRRRICALFVRVVGLDENSADALTRHQDLVTSLNVAIRPYTSSPGILQVDDKGLVFTLGFGLPQDAHADDAVRAVRAGLAIQTELARIGLGCAIGVDTGDGVCMPIGGHERRQYWAVGAFMHVAARLMQAAGTGILCTEEVADSVREVVSLSPERRFAFKGIRRRVVVFRVREAAIFDEHTNLLFGRDEEQRRLERALDACAAGTGAVIGIVGDAGLGKTTLMHYARQQAEARGLGCLSGGTGSAGVAAAYAAWGPVFAHLIGDPSSWQHLTQQERWQRLGALRHPQLTPLVNVVLPGYLDETPLTQSLTGQARADAISTVLTEVLTANAPARLVLIFEDCHWLDSASWRLLLRIAQDHPRALILLTSRSTAVMRELAGVDRLVHLEQMVLRPLHADAIGALVDRLFEHRSVPDGVIEEITHRALGNPLFAREYALLLTTRPHESVTAGVGSVTPAPSLSSADRPVTVNSLIAGRLDALAPEDHLTLNGASVIGDRFTTELLASAVPDLPLDRLLASLGSLTDCQLIEPAGVAADGYVFQHGLIREVTYGQLTGDQRRQLHRRVAEAIEAKYRQDLRPHFTALAHHWSQAESPEQTIHYADAAATQALAAGAFDEAERLLERCIRLTHAPVSSADDTRVRWYRQLADARNGMGRLESRLAAAHQALRLASVTRSQSKAGLVTHALLQICRLPARRLRPIMDADTRAHRLDIARAYRHSAEVCYFSNDMLGMLCDSISAVTSASIGAPSAVLAGASTELGGILTVAGLRRTGERILRQAIVTAEAAGDQAAQAYAHMISCLYYVGICNWEAAEASAHRCQELCEPMDDRVNWTNAQAVRFWMSRYRSHDAAADDAARSLRDRANETGNRQHRAWACRFLALCALRRGDAPGAKRELKSALDALGETAALNERIPTLGLLALAQLSVGDREKAHVTAKVALALLQKIGRPIGHGTLEGYSALFTVSLDAWRDTLADEWRRDVAACLRVLKRYQRSFPVGTPRYQFHLGEYLRRAGAERRARRSFAAGEATALRLGMPWEARQCRNALDALTQ